MARKSAFAQRVTQVAELVRRLNRDELRQLIRLVPELQAEQENLTGRREDLVKWAREQMAPYAVEARPMRPEDTFIEDTTIAGYFDLPEEERERIWTRLYTRAIEAMDEQR